MTPQDQAKAFLFRVFERVEHGDPLHRTWLKQELLLFVDELTQLIEPPTLRAPSQTPGIKDGGDLDWAAAKKAAEAIIHHCDSAWFQPPEATSMHQARVMKVCEALSTIVDALRIRKA
jgi:hypothetical protein